MAGRKPQLAAAVSPNAGAAAFRWLILALAIMCWAVAPTTADLLQSTYMSTADDSEHDVFAAAAPVQGYRPGRLAASEGVVARQLLSAMLQVSAGGAGGSSKSAVTVSSAPPGLAAVNVDSVATRLLAAAVATWQLSVVSADSNRGLRPTRLYAFGRWHYAQVPAQPQGTVAFFPGCARAARGFFPFDSSPGGCSECLGEWLGECVSVLGGWGERCVIWKVRERLDRVRTLPDRAGSRLRTLAACPLPAVHSPHEPTS